ncbi:T9SS C-terminal target domain-containing protein [Chaetoceros tenuissimus]|uniref:T9SS C-terminal target domain-containing protein n=1 Tax=Chaetoceros tenuissimus TaxID=426638 RepID=A0AAD3D3H8_9STRA|nr:T9SS C-terminal target domain-containing protein [Chaetoceros tenuissimus]
MLILGGAMILIFAGTTDAQKVQQVTNSSFAETPSLFKDQYFDDGTSTLTSTLSTTLSISSQERKLNNMQPKFQFSSSAHACVLSYVIVQCVGYNNFGQIGQDPSVIKVTSTPVELNFDSTIATPVKVVTGYDHTCTLMSDGSIWCNGSNGFQQLGDGTSNNSASPVQVKKNGGAVITNAVDIEAGAYHNCAIDDTGALYCWGFNSDGQLGLTMDGLITETSVFKMALSMIATCVVTEHDKKSVTCVGYDYSSSNPISLGNDIEQMTAGSTHFCARLNDGTAKCWGANQRGQLGIGSAAYTADYHDSPVLVLGSAGSTLTGITHIDAGHSSTCVVANNQPMCFGDNSSYQLGSQDRHIPIVFPRQVSIAIISGKSLVSIHVGEHTGHVVYNDDSIYSWGTNHGGTFGDGSTVSSGNVIGAVHTVIATEMNVVIGSNSPSSLPSCSAKDWTQIGSQIIGDATQDHLGQHVALSFSRDGSTIAVGGRGNDDGGTDAGHAKVYRIIDGSWQQIGQTIIGEVAGGRSGSVSISEDGTTLAIGAICNNGCGGQAGHARIFDYQNGQWTQRGLDIDALAAGDRFGNSLSISADGNTVAIGAATSDATEIEIASGQVRVFRWSGSEWQQLGNNVNGSAGDDRFGTPTVISADGNTIAAGGHRNDGNGANAGHARVFQYDSTSNTWNLVGSALEGAAANDMASFTGSVAISSDGSIVVLGSAFNDANDLVNSGHVRIFEFSGTNWEQRGQTLTCQAAVDQFGEYVSISSDGNIVAIGSRYHDSNGFANSGRVMIYHYDGSSWMQLGRNLDGQTSEIQFASVSLSGDGESVLIGAPFDDTNNGVDSGSAQIYSYLAVDNC